MDIRYSCNQRDFKRYTTQETRDEFLITGLYKADEVVSVYSHVDRMVTFGCMPVNEMVPLEKGPYYAFFEKRFQENAAGGMKIVRVALLSKQGKREVRRTFQPRKVQVVRFEGKGVEETMLHQVAVFAFVYIALILTGMFLISLDGRFGFETNFTAALTCVSNVGPGLASVGPVENFAGYSDFSKVVLSMLMLAGRLELFPILVLFHPSLWKKG